LKLIASMLFVLLTSDLWTRTVAAEDPETIWDETVSGVDTVFLEDLTSGEIPVALRNGITSAIEATRALEQNGPNVVTGKHNYVLRVTADAIVQLHGRILVSSIVQFLPAGGKSTQ